MTTNLQTFFAVTALAALSSPIGAQRADLSVEQVAPGRRPAIPQAESPHTRPSTEVQQINPNASVRTPTRQLTTSPAGREPGLRQLAPRSAAGTPTAQLAERSASPRVNALPPDLVDACEQGTAGKGPPPKGVDCSTMVQADARAPDVSAEEALLTSATEREGQRLAREQTARGLTPDAGEVARRLSTGDITNAPVAQAVAAQAASETISQNSSPQPDSRVVIVPGGGSVVVPPSGRGN